jgi:hypothetical protein
MRYDRCLIYRSFSRVALKSLTSGLILPNDNNTSTIGLFASTRTYCIKSDPSTPPSFVLRKSPYFLLPFQSAYPLSFSVSHRSQHLGMHSQRTSHPDIPVDGIKCPTISRGIVKPKIASLPTFLYVFGQFGSNNYTCLIFTFSITHSQVFSFRVVRLSSVVAVFSISVEAAAPIGILGVILDIFEQ